ncbi:DNA-binding response regulator [Arenicella chitinivorans]|uniref:DNA-binding response regulator n=1 Tax=Arenicella chitinivorans TaxID=1329800 RepID=A0A918RIG8_9GAMM|nr:response regulator transcription factor [Arenicella chitinivorans]GHA00357.1 DNA-binding response regulator [Arenicella chitinivorans]
MRILIIEDNPDIAANVGDYLSLEGHDVDFASDGVMGLHLALELPVDLLVLDINLPRLDGFSLAQRLRVEHQRQTPILMLTARDSLTDKVRGFHSGAWDYLVKPFELKELGLRVDALALRNQANQSRELHVGDLSLLVDAQLATRQGQVLALHHAALTILEMLMRASPNAVSRRDLEYALWGEDPPQSSPLRSHIHELRHALDKGFADQMLHTLRGVGYAIRDPQTETE